MVCSAEYSIGMFICHQKYYLPHRTLHQQGIETFDLKNFHNQDDMDEFCLVILALSRRNL